MRVACVLAGSRGDADSVAALQDKPLKAFVRVGGDAMIDHVLRALREFGGFDKIVVCIPEGEIGEYAPGLAAMHAAGEVSIVPPDESPAASVLKILDFVPSQARMMVTTADHPLLSAAMIDAFLKDAIADVNVAMVPLGLIQEAYPGSRRTKLRFSDGAFSGCNLFYFRAHDAGIRIVSYWRRLEALRKKPLRMAFAIGPLTLLRFVFRRLSLRGMFDAIGSKAKVSIRPVLLSIPEAGIDVDKIEDFELVEEIFRSRN